MASAFENQFLKEIPNYSSYKREDQILSPETEKKTLRNYGLEQAPESTSDSSSAAVPAPKPKLSRLNANQPAFMSMGASLAPQPHLEMGAAAGPAVAESSQDDTSIKDYSVFKAMERFSELNNGIKSTEKCLYWLGLFLALVLGALDLLLVLIYCFMPKNSLIDWSIKMSGKAEMFAHSRASVVYVNVVAALKSFCLIIWFFGARIYIK